MRLFNMTPFRSKTVLGLALAAAAAIAATTVALAAPPAPAAGHSRAAAPATQAIVTTTASQPVVTTREIDPATAAGSQDAATAGNGQPAGHGAAVEAAVVACKAALAPGEHGIGACVSAVANKHGKTVSAAAKSMGGHPAK